MSQDPKDDSASAYILNESTGKMVLRNGKVGKKILGAKKEQLKLLGEMLDMDMDWYNYFTYSKEPRKWAL